jgi:sulfite reductase (ferredoxin)
MVRIKLPYGKITPAQLRKIADVSDKYSNGNLHLTTRQDVQIHHVSLDYTPELWYTLEHEKITIREACGNTVRNVTASALAGVDPDEPFDVSPYAQATFEYFLRKGFCQELGRKLKFAFSSSDKDSALTYIHDLGFIPKIKNDNGNIQRGFKVLIGGGLGAQPFLAQTATDFLPEDKLIPFTEATIRVFERFGERSNRHKARLKYLIAKIGLEEFLKLVQEEEKALISKSFVINAKESEEIPAAKVSYTNFKLKNTEAFNLWKQTNTVAQKQIGYFAAFISVPLGNISSTKARELANAAEIFANNNIRITINQNLVFRFVAEENLGALYETLVRLNLANPGYNSVADITSCPGTDTCNLAISNSTTITQVFEKVIRDEFSHLIKNNDIKIKLSGCMNSCGQHALANIGFHGSSFKNGDKVVPALQLVLGGGSLGNGSGRIAEKIIKVPSRRGPDTLRILLNDYEENANDGEYFNSYYDRKGKDYFYQLLKNVADASHINDEELIDWGADKKYQTAIGVGECAGVVIDLFQTLLFEAEEKLQWAYEAIENNNYGDAVFYSYASLLHGAKALLLYKNIPVNTQHGVIRDFDLHFVNNKELPIESSFADLVDKIRNHEPNAPFASQYYKEAIVFYEKVKIYHTLQTNEKKAYENTNTN